MKIVETIFFIKVFPNNYWITGGGWDVELIGICKMKNE